MNILLDENLDWRLRRDLPGHRVESVPLIGWAGHKNGVLLARAEERFDVLLTLDSKMTHQQNLARFKPLAAPPQSNPARASLAFAHFSHAWPRPAANSPPGTRMGGYFTAL